MDKMIRDNLEEWMRIELREKVCFHLSHSRMECLYLQLEPGLTHIKTMSDHRERNQMNEHDLGVRGATMSEIIKKIEVVIGYEIANT